MRLSGEYSGVSWALSELLHALSLAIIHNQTIELTSKGGCVPAPPIDGWADWQNDGSCELTFKVGPLPEHLWKSVQIVATAKEGEVSTARLPAALEAAKAAIEAATE